MNDPLTSISRQLASRAPTSRSNSNYRPRPPPTTLPTSSSEARLIRESSERQRALELIKRKKRELQGSETPSTVHGGFEGYADQFNRKEVEEAHRGRDRRWDTWDQGSDGNQGRRRGERRY